MTLKFPKKLRTMRRGQNLLVLIKKSVYTGYPRRAFLLPVAYEVQPKGASGATRPMRDLGACRDTGISLLLSTSAWVLLSPPMERRETRPTALRPCPRTVWREKVAQSSTLDQAGDWTRDLLVGSQRSYQLCQPRTHVRNDNEWRSCS